MKKSQSKKSSILWLVSVAILAVGLLFFCQFYFGDKINSKSTYLENTHVNGIDISGMTRAEADNYLQEKLLEKKEDISITLKGENKEWKISGEDLSLSANITPTLTKIMNYGREGNVFEKKKTANLIKKDGLYATIPYQDIYGGIDSKIDQIVQEIESFSSPTILFNPEASVMFSISEKSEVKVVNRALLEEKIALALDGKEQIIELPLQEILPDKTLEDFVNSISLRGKFETDYSRSNNDRKSNVALALSKFNGIIIEPNQQISFNQITGDRTKENGYKNAKIIFGGKYVSGVGGGVCQASTTLYNALLKAGIEIMQVCHHSLPASYVPLSFDAMVSENYADLVFKNQLDTPIFIKTFSNDTTIGVEIYGEPIDDGIEYRTRSQLVKILPHSGDDIITDEKGEYENKVLYKGEYFRLKFPQEGYESKGYLQTYKNGEMIEEKEIRHDKYLPQNGIIIEGKYNLEEGMTLPSNTVKYIPPQKVTSSMTESAKARWTQKTQT